MNDRITTIFAMPRATAAGLRVPALALAVVAAVLLVPAGNAAAHGYDRVYYETYAHGHVRIVLPHWLRDDYGFRRWYGLNHYRFAPHVSWRGLHRHYLRDHHYHRSLKRGPGNAHRDRRHGKRGHHPRRRGHGR